MGIGWNVSARWQRRYSELAVEAVDENRELVVLDAGDEAVVVAAAVVGLRARGGEGESRPVEAGYRAAGASRLREWDSWMLRLAVQVMRRLGKGDAT